MITLTRLNGATLAVNPDLISVIDVTPDTTLLLTNGDRIIVRESLDEVIERVVHYRQRVSGQSFRVADRSSETHDESTASSETVDRRKAHREG